MESRQLCDVDTFIIWLSSSEFLCWTDTQKCNKASPNLLYQTLRLMQADDQDEEQIKVSEDAGRQVGEQECDGQKEWANLFCRLDFQWTCSLPLPLFPLVPLPVVEWCAAFSPVSLRLLSAHIQI